MVAIKNKAAGGTDRKKAGNKLSREDWLYAGFRALCAGGPAGIRAEAIARELKTTKGSFYWHFRDVPDYIGQMLEFWRFKATMELIERMELPDTDPAGQLRLMVEIVSETRDEIYGGLRAEPAIRQWAIYLPEAKTAVSEVDALRLAWLRSRFELLDFKAPAAALHAANIYALIIGLEHLEMQDKASLKDGLGAYLDGVLNA